MAIRYIPFEESYRDELIGMVMSLYQEDPNGVHMTSDKVDLTIAFLEVHPGAGEIVLFSKDNTIVGYAFLIRYWSNEYGGQVLFIDELFVKETFRSQHIGSAFIQYLLQDVHDEYKSIVLEVLPDNERAYKLYTHLGFKKAKNHFLRYEKKSL